MFNVKRLFEYSEILNSKTKYTPNEDEYRLAFTVEVAELMNELQVHKWWKNDVSVDNEKMLEEFADVLIFAAGASVQIKGMAYATNATNEIDSQLEVFNEYVERPKGSNMLFLQWLYTKTSIWKTVGLIYWYLISEGYTDEDINKAVKNKYEKNLKRWEKL